MNTNFDYKTLFFDAEANTTKSSDLAPVISYDHANRLSDNINTLAAILGVTEMIPMPAGATVNRYKTTVTKGAKQATEGDIVPLTKVEQKPLAPLTLKLNPYRKVTTAQAIQSAGQELALNKTDSVLLNEVRKDIRNDFFDTIATSSASTKAGTAATMQKALAKAWGKLKAYFEDVDATPVFFVNPLDMADYLGDANISVQTEFGFTYVENFMALGTVISTPRVEQGHVFATASENLNGVYVPQSGDVATAFDLTYDESGLVGMTHSRADDRASIQTLVMAGVLFYAEDASGVIEATISPASSSSLSE